MIDFYALTSPNVQKIYIMLEELGLPYKEHFVDVWAGQQYKPEFLKINPNAKVPAIVDHEGPGGKPYTVFESGAILLYLAEKTGRFLPTDTAKKYEVIQWLMIQLTGVGPMFGQWTHFKMFAPAGSDYATRPSSSASMRCSRSGSASRSSSAATNTRLPTLPRSRGPATTTPRASSGTTTRTWRAGSTRFPSARP